MAALNCRWVSFNHNAIIHQIIFHSSVDTETGAKYNINTNGMHAKAKTANDYVNIWSQINILNIPIDAMEVYIIALSKTEENAYKTYLVSLETKDSLVNNQNNDQQSGQQSSLAANHYNFGRRGNSVISQSNFGK